MAMIKCPECGKEISDKAESCPGCGCPASEIKKPESARLEEIKDEQIQQLFEESQQVLRIDLGKNSYIEIRGDIMAVHDGINQITDYINNFVLLYDKTSMGFDHVVRFTHDAFKCMTGLEIPKWNKNYDKSFELSRVLREKAVVKEKSMIGSANYQTDAQKERSKKEYEQRKEEYASRPKEPTDWNKIIAESKIPKCPRCHSTAISYDTKKLSVGRGVVGGLVAGTPGMIMGGLSSKKGYAVCLNCGKRWKI